MEQPAECDPSFDCDAWTRTCAATRRSAVAAARQRTDALCQLRENVLNQLLTLAIAGPAAVQTELRRLADLPPARPRSEDELIRLMWRDALQNALVVLRQEPGY